MDWEVQDTTTSGIPTTIWGYCGGSKDKGGEPLAGITASFATNVCDEIDTYISTVDEAISEMEAEASNQAFQGTAITEAMTNFIQSVIDTAKAYTSKLKEAENQIINSVADVYSKQDADISDQLATDGTTIQNAASN